MSMSGLDGGGVICGIDAGDKDVTDQVSHLGSAKVKIALWLETYLRFLFKSAEVASQL